MEIRRLTVGILETNCYLVWKKKEEAVLIDPGGEIKKIEALLESCGAAPCAILLTHGHFDHFGAAKGLADRFGIPVAIGEKDAEKLTDGRKNLSSLMGLSVKEVEPDRLAREGDVIEAGGLSFSVLSTPGHSSGSVVYRCGDVLFTGDTLFAGSIGRTDFPDSDPVAMRESLRKLASVTGDLRICPGHGPETTLEAEKSTNPFLGV